MNLRFTKKFLKQISKHSSTKLGKEILLVIESAENALSISDLKNVKKLSGYQTYYRIRLGDYRIGLNLAGNTLEFVTFDHRKDIYKYFP
jgi:mRNA interferase RelE/StbE